ncbi:MAG TPA: BON domain-containing protein [Parvularculaceae bacterium]|nr:BON domain-containing protein [Parvularculaceae bacterium]
MKPIAVALAGLCLAIAGCASSRNLDDSLSDIGANADLKGVLFADRSHDYGDVDITIYEGRLMLTGTMKSEEGRRKLIENAWKAAGVDQVIDEILVGDGTSLGQGFEDARIDTALRAKLIADGDVKAGNFKTAVSKGVVYILGATPSERQLNAALDIARSIGGVEKVVSHILVEPL